MDNPLSPEHIKKLNELAKLPQDQQQKELPELLKTLNQEQIAFLKQQQLQGQDGKGQCLFCMLAEGKVETKKIFEDDKTTAALDIHPAARGHVLIIPKKHGATLDAYTEEEVTHYFSVANKIAQLLVKELNVHGVNIYLAQGDIAGQTLSHIVIHVIPRTEGDNISFGWSPTQPAAGELDKTRQQLHGKVTVEQEAAATPKEEDLEEKEEEDSVCIP